MQEVWEDTLRQLESRLGREICEIWLQPLRLSLSGEVYCLEAPDAYHLEWVEWNYSEMIVALLSQRLGQLVSLRYTVSQDEVRPDPSREPIKKSPTQPPLPALIHDIQPDPLRTFDSFVVGHCNRFAHAACQSITENRVSPDSNPLFLYGSTGLGKTHLLHSISNRLRHDSGAGQGRVVHTTAERFVSEMITALRFNKLDTFREVFRNQVGVLLIDDIQFLSGKNRSQEEFFHAFQALYESGRQIVITCDDAPGALQRLAPRLKSRFEGGLVADLHPPEPETMLAILMAKAESMGLRLPGDIAEWIASSYMGNVRGLEGILKRLAGMARMLQLELSLEEAQRILDLQRGPHPARSPGDLVEEVARAVQVDVKDLKGRKRGPDLQRGRQLSVLLLRQHTQLSSRDIGTLLGGRSHSTILSVERGAQKKLAMDSDFRSELESLRKSLRLF